MNKKFLTIMPISMLAFSLFSCTNNEEPPIAGITYEKYDVSTIRFNDNDDSSLEQYNPKLYYLNEWKEGYKVPGQTGTYFPDMGDPCIVYDDGYYYAFGTRGTTTFHCFRTKDFNSWERMADAFVPQSGSWGKTDLWAPDIHKIGDKWYLYYTANHTYSDGSKHCQIGVAIADKPYGPYVQYTGTNANNEEITIDKPAFLGLEKTTILDQNVFVDDDGQMYLYFSLDTKTVSNEIYEKYSVFSEYSNSSFGETSELWAVKMKDEVTWDLSTLVPIASAGYKNYDDPIRTIDWETYSPSFHGLMECLEGPYMIKSGNKYILTYCANSYVDVEYSVGYAVSDSPLGPFTKPNSHPYDNMILGVPGAPGSFVSNRYHGMTTGTGHAAIFETGSGQYMFSYHAHWNRDDWDVGNLGTWRALAVDYLYFDENDMPYANGPTYSLQNTPEDVSGCVDLIHDATVKVEGENGSYLYDNFTNRDVTATDLIKEANFEAGTRSIEIVFEGPVTVEAINIYNSCNYEKAIDYIDQIDFGNGNGIVNALFNQRYIKEDFIFPHSAFNIEIIDGVVTERIVITISSDFDFSLGEIEIIGNKK